MCCVPRGIAQRDQTKNRQSGYTVAARESRTRVRTMMRVVIPSPLNERPATAKPISRKTSELAMKAAKS
jgi:hypothetical protein